MKKLLLTLLIPLTATADSHEDQWLLEQFLENNRQAYAAPVYGLPVQPVLPVPNDRGPMGTGYSIVTTTKPKVNPFDSDVTGQETVQRVVPNDILGNPIRRGIDW